MPTIQLHLTEDDDAETVEFSAEQFDALRANDVLTRDGDAIRTTPDNEWWVDEDCQPDEDERLTSYDIRVLADVLVRLPKGNGPLSDREALDLINYCLSAPEWSVSFLEDIAAIVARTPRAPVPGAQWASH